MEIHVCYLQRGPPRSAKSEKHHHTEDSGVRGVDAEVTQERSGSPREHGC